MSDETEALRCECGHTEKQHNGNTFCCACACDSFAADVAYRPLNAEARERAKRDAARNLSSRHARDVLSYEATVASLESQLSALTQERDGLERDKRALNQTIREHDRQNDEMLAASSLRERTLAEELKIASAIIERVHAPLPDGASETPAGQHNQLTTYALQCECVFCKRARAVSPSAPSARTDA